MIANPTNQTGEQLELRSRLSDMVQLHPWIETLASRHSIPSDMQFAIELCLEEVVSNVIRHGYAGAAEDSWVIVRFTMLRAGDFEFIVDDEAPRFNPLNAPEPKVIDSDEEIRVGGQGIRLVRQFANAVEYEETPTGNRLRMSFSPCQSAPRSK